MAETPRKDKREEHEQGMECGETAQRRQAEQPWRSDDVWRQVENHTQGEG